MAEHKYIGNLRDTRVPASPCPYCGNENDAAMAANPERPDATPKPGDITICTTCASPLVFTERLRTRKPFPGEVDIAEPTIRRAIAAVHNLGRRNDQGTGEKS